MKTNIRHIVFSFCMIIIVITCPIHGEPSPLSDNLPEAPDDYFLSSYHALVVGVGSYDHWPACPNAAENAKAVADALQKTGFSVTLKINPTSRDLNAELLTLEKEGQAADQGILFYYTGVGATRSLTDGTQLGYIVPRDCPLLLKDPVGFEKKAVSMRDMEALSVKIRARHVLMLFDASFSGDIFRINKPTLKTFSEKNLLPMRQFIIAGRADEPVPKKSVFQKYLLMGLKGNADLIYDGYITGSELGVYLSNSVKKATGEQQHPQYGLIKSAGLSGGDFVFRTLSEDAATDKGSLFVSITPENAAIRILNIKPKFRNGMALDPGGYLLEASLKGYQKQIQWVRLTAGEKKTLEFKMEKIVPVIINSLGMKFVYINPGRFTMGSALNKYRTAGDETPHRVTLTQGFYMQATEVTVGQFRQFIQATGYTTEAGREGGCWIRSSNDQWKKHRNSQWDHPGSWETPEISQTGVHPVTCVTWNDAVAFITWLNRKEKKGYDLPTEAEWEYCCRAGTATAFSFGNCMNMKQANFKRMGPDFSTCADMPDKPLPAPVPVGSFAAGKWELYDMHGNVAEWCKDRYSEYPEYPVKNPDGPLTGMDRVIRGGHWASVADACRSARRGSFRQNSASDVIGFRLVLRP